LIVPAGDSGSLPERAISYYRVLQENRV
jgi:hypothetical protein